MDVATLAHAMGNAVTDARYAQLLGPFTAAMAAAGCTTVDRAAMWCAQLGHESMGLRYMEELADGTAYEGRHDLGNNQRGDGARFKGRGPIQVTGRANYTALSTWAHTRGLAPSPTFFVDHPEQLASDLHGFTGAVWYWTAARPMNRYADARDLDAATKAINGGLNGIEARRQRWQRCLAIGAALLDAAEPAAPTEGDWFDMATRDDLYAVVRDVCGNPAQRSDTDWMRNQLAAVLRFNPAAAPGDLAADPTAGDLVRGADIGYLVSRIEALAAAAPADPGAPATPPPDMEALADLVADRLFARVVAYGGLPE